MQAVPITQVNATVPTSAAPIVGKFNNIDSQIGTQIADGSSKQILSQTVVQKTIPSVPATMMYTGIAMTMPGMTMTMPGRTMTKPGMTMTKPGMTMTKPGIMTGTMTMNGTFLALFLFFL